MSSVMSICHLVDPARRPPDFNRTKTNRGLPAEGRVAVSATDIHDASRDAAVGKVDIHFEVDIIPVSDVDRAKQFYQRLGWRLDGDVATLDGLRIVQFTPSGSAAPVNFGTGITT